MRVPDLSGLTMSSTPLRIGAGVDDAVIATAFADARNRGDLRGLNTVVQDLQEELAKCKMELQELKDSLFTPKKGKRSRKPFELPNSDPPASPPKSSPKTPSCPPRAKCDFFGGDNDPANLEQLNEALQGDSGPGPATRSRAQQARADMMRAGEGGDPGDGAGGDPGPSSSGAGGSNDPFKTPSPARRR